MGKDLKGKELGKNLSQRKDGRYEAKYVDNFGKRHSIYGEKLSEVRKALNEALYNKEHNIYSKYCKLTLNEWFDIWSETYYLKRVKPTTYGAALDRYDNVIRKSSLGQMRLDCINNIHIQTFINNLIEEKPYLKRSSIKSYISPIKEAFNQAIECGYISINPVNKVTMPNTKSKIRESLTKREQELFFIFAETSSYYNLFQFLLLTGVRCGEAFALTWDDVDLQKRTIDINKTASEIKGNRKEICKKMGYDNMSGSVIVTQPKTRASIRKIPMSNDCYNLMSKLYMKRNREVDLVFHTKTNSYHNHSNVDRRLSDICNEINEKSGETIRHISLHCFRHTFATRCFESGVNVKTVQYLLGHNNIETTLEIYTHVTRDFAMEEINKMSI